MKPRFAPYLKPAATLLALAALAGCAKRQDYQVVLGERESIEAGAPVHVDDIRAGRVTSVGEEGGERIANFDVEKATAGDKMREGIFRVPSEGRIDLISREVERGARPLPKGARIPTRSQFSEIVTRFANSSTYIACGVALAAFALLFVIFKSLVTSVGLIICSAISGMVTHAVYLYVVPLIAWLYDRFPPPGAGGEEEAAASPQAADVVRTPEGGADVIGNAVGTITELLVNRPDPKVLAWCVTFVVMFVVLNLVLGKAARIWRK